MAPLPSPRKLTCDAATAAVHAHGAHVVEWTPAGHLPVLWMSAESWADSDKPIRGGIPVCFPWFGAGRSGGMAPAHGYARIQPWQMHGATQDGDASTLVLELAGSGTAAFPHPLLARLTVRSGRELHLELTVTNTGDAPVTFEEALHTYLVVGDIRDVRVIGLDECQYVDKAPGAAAGLQHQIGDIVFAGETDRVYRSTDDIVLEDPRLRRRIIVRRSGSANAVVWNPWIDKAAAMPDFGDDEWQGMVCIEGANVLGDAIELQPGASHTMGYTLAVEHLT